MEIEFLGGNCVRVKTKTTTIIIDDNLAKIGGKSPQTDKTVALFTNIELMGDATHKSRLVVDSPGEFEIGDITVKGLQTRSHMDEEGQLSATVYQFMAANQTITVLGHIHPDLPGDLLELVSGTEVLVVPVGGNGYTLDPVGAVSVVKKLEPGVVIPTQYEIDGLSYEVPASPLEEFLKLMPSTEEEPSNSCKLAKIVTGEGTSQTKVVVLNPLTK